MLMLLSLSKFWTNVFNRRGIISAGAAFSPCRELAGAEFNVFDYYSMFVYKRWACMGGAGTSCRTREFVTRYARKTIYLSFRCNCTFQ